MSVSSNKVVFVVVLSKTRRRYLFSSDKLSGVLQTKCSCARLVRVLIVVALCDVGL